MSEKNFDYGELYKRFTAGISLSESEMDFLVEQMLRSLKYVHVYDPELDKLIAGTLDVVSKARVEAHLKLCFICERKKQLLEEEAAAVAQGSSEEDKALARRLLAIIDQRQV